MALVSGMKLCSHKLLLESVILVSIIIIIIILFLDIYFNRITEKVLVTYQAALLRDGVGKNK